MSSDTITLELDKYESGVVFHSRNCTARHCPKVKACHAAIWTETATVSFK